MDRITASFNGPSLDGQAPGSIVFFPAGTHSISASKGGKPIQLQVVIGEELAAKLDTQLKTSIAAAAEGKQSRPFVDFQHEEGRAAAIPTGFRWEAGKGVMLDLDWTPAGREAVEGKEFSYFSPSWIMDGDQIAGLAQPGPIGGLVNVPAFQSIPKIAAALASMDYLKTEILSIFLDLGLITQEQVETIAADEAVALVRKIADEKKEMTAAHAAEVEKVTAVHNSFVAELSQTKAALVTARACVESLTARAETAEKEAVAVKSSLPYEVAKVVAAAALPAPLKAVPAPKDEAQTSDAIYAGYKAIKNENERLSYFQKHSASLIRFL